MGDMLQCALWGPFVMISDMSAENQAAGIVLAVLCVAAISSLAVKRDALTALLAIGGVLLWIATGIVGCGIDV